MSMYGEGSSEHAAVLLDVGGSARCWARFPTRPSAYRAWPPRASACSSAADGMCVRFVKGSGELRDTINSLGHAGRQIVECVAAVLETEADEVCQQAGDRLLAARSIKARLDVDWNVARAEASALTNLGIGCARNWCAPRSPRLTPVQRSREGAALPGAGCEAFRFPEGALRPRGRGSYTKQRSCGRRGPRGARRTAASSV